MGFPGIRLVHVYSSCHYSYFWDISLPFYFWSFMKYDFVRIASCHPSKSKLPFYPDLLSYQLWFFMKLGPRAYIAHITVKYKRPYALLKRKFSSGREGALTSTNKSNYQKWCFAFIFESFLCLFEENVYRNAEISKTEDCEFCTWATYFIINYQITVKCMFWRKYPFQDAQHASIVSLLCKTPHKSNVVWTDV